MAGWIRGLVTMKLSAEISAAASLMSMGSWVRALHLIWELLGSFICLVVAFSRAYKAFRSSASACLPRAYEVLSQCVDFCCQLDRNRLVGADLLFSVALCRSLLLSAALCCSLLLSVVRCISVMLCCWSICRCAFLVFMESVVLSPAKLGDRKVDEFCDVLERA